MAASAALGWPRDRAAAALDAVRRRPAIADPLALLAVGPETYRLAARQDRLSAAQREALGRVIPAADGRGPVPLSGGPSPATGRLAGLRRR